MSRLLVRSRCSCCDCPPSIRMASFASSSWRGSCTRADAQVKRRFFSTVLRQLALCGTVHRSARHRCAASFQTPVPSLLPSTRGCMTRRRVLRPRVWRARVLRPRVWLQPPATAITRWRRLPATKPCCGWPTGMSTSSTTGALIMCCRSCMTGWRCRPASGKEWRHTIMPGRTR